MRNIKAICVKEFIHIIRDRRTLMLVLLMPFIQVMIYGFGVNTDIKYLRTYVFDQDQTYLSRRLIDSLEAAQTFKVVEKVYSYEALRDGLDKGKIKAALVIPERFTADVLKKKPVNLQMLIDGTDSNPANIALNGSQAIINHFMQQEGLTTIGQLPIDHRPRLWYNPDLRSTYFMLPGLIGLMIQLIIPMLTASAIVREKERGNIEQLLVTPIKPYELIVGKIIPYVVLGLMIATSILLTMTLLFKVPIRGSLLTLYGYTLLYLTVCLGIGLWGSAVADNQHQATQIVMLFAMPSVLLSGFIFPRETMPFIVYQIGHILPMTYFLVIVRGVVLKGMSAVDLWAQAWPLALMAVFILMVSIKRFNKRMV